MLDQICLHIETIGRIHMVGDKNYLDLDGRANCFGIFLSILRDILRGSIWNDLMVSCGVGSAGGPIRWDQLDLSFQIALRIKFSPSIHGGGKV